MAITATTNIIQINAPTNFPIKLTSANFPVWRRQVEATLIGFGLLGYVDGTLETPSPFTDVNTKVVNPCYTIWYRQDQVIISALLGSCSEPIQPLISSAITARDAWDTLMASYANASPGRILSLKAKLARNPRGTRSIPEYLKDMQDIAADLALAKCPVSTADLIVSILNQLGDDYRPIVAALRVRNTDTTMFELSEILLDHERLLKESEEASSALLATANATQRFSSSHHGGQFSANRDSGGGRGRGSYGRSGQRGGQSQHGGNNRPGPICKFCNFPGHVVRDYRKLVCFLRDNNF